MKKYTFAFFIHRFECVGDYVEALFLLVRTQPKACCPLNLVLVTDPSNDLIKLPHSRPGTKLKHGVGSNSSVGRLSNLSRDIELCINLI